MTAITTLIARLEELERQATPYIEGPGTRCPECNLETLGYRHWMGCTLLDKHDKRDDAARNALPVLLKIIKAQAEALRKLNNECVAMLSAHEDALRVDNGNTNVECLLHQMSATTRSPKSNDWTARRASRRCFSWACWLNLLIVHVGDDEDLFFLREIRVFNLPDLLAQVTAVLKHIDGAFDACFA